MADSLDPLRSALADRYAVERELGRGGMAAVYLATDLKHGRRVAVKVLDPAIAQAIGPERFLQEIELAARLTHPNILPLHDSGEADGLLYYVMPYIEGESLRDRLNRERHLKLDDAVRVVQQVAEALSHAHGQGVIHRDIKPENILFAGGQAVVADFGIARAVDAAGGERLTETGLAVGTPAYMSPEQANADRMLDARSDIYSLGCLAYEILGGEPPFTGPSPMAVMARHSVDPVPRLRTLRPTIPEAVEHALEKALAKVPADRYDTAVEFAAALGQAGAAGAPAEAAGPARRERLRWGAAAAGVVAVVASAALWVSFPAGGPAYARLAVLVPANRTSNANQEYVLAGMHSALISDLAQIPGVSVINQQSMLQYVNTDLPVREIARQLGVDAVIDPSLVLAPDSFEIDVRLVDGRTEAIVGKPIVRRGDVQKVTTLQRDLIRAMADELRRVVAPRANPLPASVRPVNPETYEAYLRGMFYLNKFTPEDIQRGLAYLHQAVEKDPADPMAYAGLAVGYATVGHSFAPPPDAWPRAREAARRAVTLDSMSAEGWAALADVKLYYEWDWEGAERAFRRANRLNPSLALNHYHYAWYLSLFGRLDEAIAEHKRAQELDPLDPLHTAWLGQLYIQAGRYDEAVAEADKSLELAPDFGPGLFVLGNAYQAKGMNEEAIEVHERMATAFPRLRFRLGVTYAAAGRPDQARAILAELEKQPATPLNAFGLAILCAALGETDKAFRWLAYEQPHAWLPWVRVNPVFEPLRDDPRYQDFLRKLNLPPP